MTNKEKQLRKDKLKKSLLKALHIVCYILSALFIVIAVVSGVQSCSKKTNQLSAENEYTYVHNRKNAINLDFSKYFVYTLKFSGDVNIDYSILIDQYDIYREPVLPNAETIYKSFGISGCKYLNYDEVLDVQYFVLEFEPLKYNATRDVYYYQIKSGSFLTADNRWFGVFYRTSEYYTDLVIHFNNIKIFLSDETTDDWIFNNWFERSTSTDLIFNKQWNYNAFLGTNLNGLYGSASFDSSGENMRYKLFNTGYFVSNGQLFNQIQIWAIQSEGNSIYSVSQGTSGGIMPAPSGYWIYSFAYYRNTETNYEILVNYHDTIPYSSGSSNSRYYANSSTWVNDSYRYVTFLGPLSDDLSIQLNAFNNNNQNYYSGNIYNDGYDVFTLLSFAFTSLGEFWSLSILPGISIGVLFFLPAVVGIVIIIVHILRK